MKIPSICPKREQGVDFYSVSCIQCGHLVFTQPIPKREQGVEILREVSK